jgi:8-amino-7-oxononanoate synthase
VLDFASSLYLGFWHGSWSLRPWAQLTTGVPAALASPPGADAVAGRLARLQGCQRATLGPSTLHLFWDLFGMLAGEGIAVYVDDGAYPIGRWGTLQAAARGVPVRRFPHRDAAALQALVGASPGLRPVVLADGVCTCCGIPPRIPAYLDAIRPRGGLLVLDDTQGLGLFGTSPGPEAPYGRGGGGSLRRGGVGGAGVVLVCSLAKGFGVPLAALSGGKALVARFEATSQTRVHCSPPSLAAIHAAGRALSLNDRVGDLLRRQLAHRVRFFRERLHGAGLQATGGLFPVQRLLPLPAAAARDLHARLLAAGVRAVLQRCDDVSFGRIVFVVTARHRADAIESAVDTLARLARTLPWAVQHPD